MKLAETCFITKPTEYVNEDGGVQEEKGGSKRTAKMRNIKRKKQKCKNMLRKTGWSTKHAKHLFILGKVF